MAGSFTHKYPYTDNEELNLDWLIKELKKLKIKVPDCPTDQDGHFVLMATVTDGAVTYEWINVD